MTGAIKFFTIAPNPGPHHGFPPPLALAFDRAHTDEREFYGEGAIRIGTISGKAEFSKRCGHDELRSRKAPGALGFPVGEDIYKQAAEGCANRAAARSCGWFIAGWNYNMTRVKANGFLPAN